MLALRYWLDIRTKYQSVRLAYQAGTWCVKNKSVGGLPVGFNRILMTDTFISLGMDESSWVASISEMASIEDQEERDERRVGLRFDFLARLKQQVAETELNDCRMGLDNSRFDFYRTLFAKKEVLEHEKYLQTADFGALLKFRLRTDTLNLGKSFKHGSLSHVSCPLCDDENTETALHFLTSCPASSGLRQELYDGIPSIPKVPQEFMSAILGTSHHKWEGRIQKFLVGLWKARGNALGLTKASSRPGSTQTRPKEKGWQPSLHHYFKKDIKQASKSPKASNSEVMPVVNLPSIHLDAVKGKKATA